MTSPTSLTLRFLRQAGYLVDVCERWIPRANVRRDLYGIGDLLAITIGEPPLLLQVTSLANVSSRVKKVTSAPSLAIWLKTGARFQVFGWGKRQGQWHPKIVELSGPDLAPMVLSRPPRRRRSRYVPGDLFGEYQE